MLNISAGQRSAAQRLREFMNLKFPVLNSTGVPETGCLFFSSKVKKGTGHLLCSKDFSEFNGYRSVGMRISGMIRSNVR